MKNIKLFLQSKQTQLIASLIIGLLLGWLLFSRGGEAIHNHIHQEISEKSSWTCSMHPQINLPEPGKCPICGMDLIPKNISENGENPSQLQMTTQAVKLANIQTTTIGQLTSTGTIKRILLNGTLQEDERKIYSQTAHFSGRIENLLVNFEGYKVQKGQTIAKIYSPELVSTQQELFESFKLFKDQPEIIESVREKLRRWKLNNAQIAAIEKNHEIINTFPIKADHSGFVKSLHVNLGDHVKEGSTMMTISDLSRLWVLFEVYENDLPFIQLGDDIEFEIKGLPGQKFTSKVTFIDPVIDPKSRIAKVRTEILNTRGLLKPEMFASGELIASNTSKTNEEIMITVPRSAVMWTGKRSLVYVRIPATKIPTFEAREVVLGRSLTHDYEILSGIYKGEEVVTNGTFTVDAAAQLNNKVSMMNKGLLLKTPIEKPIKDINLEIPDFSAITDKKFMDRQKDFVKAYLALKDALVTANYETAKQHNQQMLEIISEAFKLSVEDVAAFWEKQKVIIMKQGKLIVK
ncbi:MAG: efflux RND transporter periplasmic adaptor subunit, partial [Bacteroidota bacterium]